VNSWHPWQCPRKQGKAGLSNILSFDLSSASSCFIDHPHPLLLQKVPVFIVPPIDFACLSSKFASQEKGGDCGKTAIFTPLRGCSIVPLSMLQYIPKYDIFLSLNMLGQI
jgi:hypothetical protein